VNRLSGRITGNPEPCRTSPRFRFFDKLPLRTDSVEVVSLEDPVDSATTEQETRVVFAMQGDRDRRAVHRALKKEMRWLGLLELEVAFPR